MTRVLIVDDDADVRAGLKKILVKSGFEVDQAADGAEALERHQANPADVLIVDIYMPGMDGIEAMVRLLVEHAGVRIIAISGGGVKDQEDVLKTAARLGAVRTIRKPFTPAEVEEAVKQALSA